MSSLKELPFFHFFLSTSMLLKQWVIFNSVFNDRILIFWEYSLWSCSFPLFFRNNLLKSRVDRFFSSKTFLTMDTIQVFYHLTLKILRGKKSFYFRVIVWWCYLRWNRWANKLEIIWENRWVNIIFLYPPLIFHIHTPLLYFQSILQFFRCFNAVSLCLLLWNRRHQKICLAWSII